MAFQLKISAGHRIDIEGKKIYVKDITGNVGDTEYVKDPDVLGGYLATINSTGYGDPNPVREDMANILVCSLKKTTSVLDVLVAVNDPLEVMEYEITVGEDGWYIFSLISLPTVAPEEPTEGNVYYDTTLGKIMKYKTGAFVEVLPKSLLNSIHVKAVTDKLVVANGSKRKIALNKKKNQLLRVDKPDRRAIEQVQRLYDEVRGLLESAVYEFCRGNKAEAQRDIEFLNTSIQDCDC